MLEKALVNPHLVMYLSQGGPKYTVLLPHQPRGKLKHAQGHRGPSQSTTPCFIIQPGPGILFNGQLRFIIQMVSKFYLWEVRSKLNQTRLLGFPRAHFPFQESTFQHSELLLLQTIFKASSGCHLLSHIWYTKWKRNLVNSKPQRKMLRGRLWDPSTDFKKFIIFNPPPSSKY